MPTARKSTGSKNIKTVSKPGKVPAKDSKVKGVKIFVPEKVEVMTIRPEKVEIPKFDIEVVTNIPIPSGSIRCIVLKEHEGMLEIHKEGDIVDLPDRRFKTLGVRGIVKEYTGERQPNRRR